MTLEKPLEEIDERDLLVLVEDKISEGRTIEYKRDMPSDSYESKKEFLADISSFANAAGGHLIIGIQEENGVPTAAYGITCDDLDREVLRFENLIRDGIEPRPQGISVRGIKLSTGTYAFVFRIPRSWSKPHVVNFKGHWRFYSRNSAGKYPLDVSEVRSSFLQASTLAERIRLFRDERLGSVISDNMPSRLIPGGRTVLHLVPYTAFESGVSFSLDAIRKKPFSLDPIWGGVTNYRYNFDGFLTINGNETGLARGYVQAFRNGIIEAVDGSMLREDKIEPTVPSLVFERELIKATETYLSVQKQMLVSPPLLIMLSLHGVHGYRMAVSQYLPVSSEDQHLIDRDTLILPEIICENYPVDAYDVARVLRPAFDAVWNASGWPKSFGYDEQGVWGKGLNCR